MSVIEIHFDGGCKPNPGRKYGSFEVLLDGLSVQMQSKIPLGYGTNNEAEFETLIRSLDWTLGSMDMEGFPSKGYSVKVFTDSTIVRNRVCGRYTVEKGEPAKRMARLARLAIERLNRFRKWEIQWNPRYKNVARFGH